MLTFTEWENKIKELLLSKYSDILIELFKFGKVDTFINKIEDPILNLSLSMVANTCRILLCFDLEFQNTIQIPKESNLSKYNYDPTIFKQKSYSFVREFGAAIFISSKGNTGVKSWYYVGNILLNFPNLADSIDSKYIRYTSAQYASASSGTKKNMSLNDDLFKNYNRGMVFNLYPVNVKYIIKDSRIKDIITLQNHLYWTDEQVKGRTLNKSNAKKFLNLFLELVNFSMCVVKGQGDVRVIQNQYNLMFGKPVSTNSFKKIYDVEIYNELSSYFFKGAKLETTFVNLIEIEKYKNNISFFKKHLASLEAHNPVADSIFTIVVAAIMNMVLLEGLHNYKIIEKN
jgi:hypothetical protein